MKIESIHNKEIDVEKSLKDYFAQQRERGKGYHFRSWWENYIKGEALRPVDGWSKMLEYCKKKFTDALGPELKDRFESEWKPAEKYEKAPVREMKYKRDQTQIKLF
jgi:hypothetical protein